MKLIKLPVVIILAAIIGSAFLLQTMSCSSGNQPEESNADSSSSVGSLFKEEQVWMAPDTNTIPDDDEGKMISYGRILVNHTSKYFGPHGTISKTTNGLSCQNCHLEAGTRPYGNNFGAVTSTYPKFLARSNSVITAAQKINECFSRSLNGEPIDTNSREMKAFLAYMNWLGKEVKKGETPLGSGGIKAPHFIDRAADPEKGKALYVLHCARCHGKNGEGMLVTEVLKDPAKQQGGTATTDDLFYYPPLWGNSSYNGVATLYRVSKFAGFVKNNMPYPMTYKTAILTDEQAWDIAAFVNSRERPIKDHSQDYASDISKKPYDFPFAPYDDNFSQEQHKFGPYTEMPSAKKKH
jgi:thiosulfate dehydrogenase